MKEIIACSCCPWCKKLPRFVMYRVDGQTWTPHLECDNSECGVKPKSKYVPIRKKQKYRAQDIGRKIHKMIAMWNENHPFRPIAGFEFDFEEVAKEERKRNGLTALEIYGWPYEEL